MKKILKKERFKVAITVSAIFQKKDKTLLMKRWNTGYMDGKWALVSGHVESEESLKQALIREVEEEIGLNIRESDLSYICGIRSKENNNYINFYFLINNFDGNIVNKEPNKCKVLKWFAINELPNNMIMNDKKAINNMLNAVSFEEYGF